MTHFVLYFVKIIQFSQFQTLPIVASQIRIRPTTLIYNFSNLD